jgi:choline kinase
MKAIILAAGKGTRLNGLDLKPKCLFEVAGDTLLRKQVTALENLDIHDIVVVVGFEANRIRRQYADGITFVENPDFETTSSLYSLWLAREYLTDGFVVLNSDVLFHPQMLSNLLTSPYNDALLVDFGEETNELLGEEEMKVKVRDGLIVDIRKDMKSGEADGENVGIAKFSSQGAKLLVGVMDELIARGYVLEWVPRAFLEFAYQSPLHVISTGCYPWIEIDFPEDYQRANEEVFPKILAMN